MDQISQNIQGRKDAWTYRSLIVWDVRTGEAVREVKLDCSNSQLSPKIMLPACGSIICDYGNQMRIVRFPLVAADKCE
ncbi:conserved hypothetical protein [Culex quinquefasciatus]|uniref:Uncharacterized protein n=1 Tax=Culex quinquefasciatus TaxID=7176 RepID=B0X215_CULQU|nr:conserved hypothetical protein [Culex quinquefasciatus]|eukprot:XP_001863687.1 conserved hypothetical protein [Culex quinquefasciatus]